MTMKSFYIKSVIKIFLLVLIIPCGIVTAGNPDRAGSSGANELLINPWARSSGWGGANSGGIHGIEAQFYNVAGVALVKKTDILFSHTNYLQGTGMSINAFGIGQKVGESGVLGITLMSLSFGEVEITEKSK